MTDKMPTIVAVDDNADAISLFHISLEALAVNFVGFKSSAEALSYLQEHRPDLLFLDILMPVMDGLSLLRYLRSLTYQKDTLVIIVTSKDYEQDRHIAKELGTVEYLIKPLRFQEIRELVFKYVDGVKFKQSNQL